MAKIECCNDSDVLAEKQIRQRMNDSDILERQVSQVMSDKPWVPESWWRADKTLAPQDEEPCACPPEGKLSAPSALERQVGGDHYKGYKIQPWTFFQVNNIPFHKADIIKRILRFDSPTGKGREDLEKIRHELDLIEAHWEEQA